MDSSTGNQKRGRQPTQIKKIEKKAHRLVSFTKRRNGLFNKAYEISTLCGATVAAVVVSEAGKLHTWGDVIAVFDKYLAEESPGEKIIDSSTPEMEMDILEQHGYEDSLPILEGKKKLDEVNINIDRFWWDKPVGQLLRDTLEALKNNVEARELWDKSVAHLLGESLEALQTNVRRRILEMRKIKASLSSLPWDEIHQNREAANEGLMRKTTDSTLSSLPTEINNQLTQNVVEDEEEYNTDQLFEESQLDANNQDHVNNFKHEDDSVGMDRFFEGLPLKAKDPVSGDELPLKANDLVTVDDIEHEDEFNIDQFFNFDTDDLCKLDFLSGEP